MRISEWTSRKEALENDASETVEIQKIACVVCGKKCETVSPMCGGGAPYCTPAVAHEEINAHQRRDRPNPWIHATIVAPQPTVISTLGESQCHSDIPFLLPQLEIDTTRDLPTWGNKNRSNGSLPIAKYEWRTPGPLSLDTVEYSAEVANDIVKSGSAATQAAGGLDGALFQFQEYEFRLLQPQLDYIKRINNGFHIWREKC